MWVVPDETGIVPSYEQAEVSAERLASGLVPVASGMPRHAEQTAIRIRNSDAALYVARLQTGQSVTIPEAPFVHLFVAVGSVTLEGAGELLTGDTVRFTATGGQRVTALAPSEILVWEMHASMPIS